MVKLRVLPLGNVTGRGIDSNKSIVRIKSTYPHVIILLDHDLVIKTVKLVEPFGTELVIRIKGLMITELG